MSVRFLRGFDFDGSHFERKGLTEGRQVVPSPLHYHDVSLDYVRIESQIDYALTDRWGLLFRLPYDVKAQSVALRPVDPASPEDRQAMLRNIEIHHRDETYRGLADPMFLATRWGHSLLREGDVFKLSLGATVPAGRTEENPYLLAARGIQHLHIQFGTGTVDPLLELNYRTPVTSHLSVGGFANGRLPVYANGKGYRGPREVTTGLSASYPLRNRLMLRLNGIFYYQAAATWDEVRDENTGLIATSALVGLTIQAGPTTSLSLDLQYPFSQRTLFSGDAFEQGPTVMFSVSRTFPADPLVKRAVRATR